MNNDINDVLGISAQTHTDTSNQNISKKYPALRTLSVIIAIIAWLVAFATIIIILGILSQSRGDGSWIIPAATLTGLLTFIGLLAYSEVIKVFIDIEENTRRTATK